MATTKKTTRKKLQQQKKECNPDVGSAAVLLLVKADRC